METAPTLLRRGFLAMLKGWLNTLKARAERLERETYALYLAYRDPRVRWWARAWAMLVVAYALSPIDLIPDFIPVLGYLDDLILVPLGIALALRMIPADVMADARARADRVLEGGRPAAARAAAVFVMVVWVLVLALAVWWMVRATRR
jgi:uncharacterized membrane protein YkvA (DUF1232 family)